MQLANRNEIPKFWRAARHEPPNGAPPTATTANNAAAELIASALKTLRIAQRSYL